jgi:fermentation-respiration switch protein FrsA (DUF1100 family)
MPDGFDVIDQVGNLAPVPVLIVHGEQDAIIPFSNGERLYAAAGDPKAFLRHTGGHIGTFGNANNRKLVLGFMERAARQRPGDTRWRDD